MKISFKYQDPIQVNQVNKLIEWMFLSFLMISSEFSNHKSVSTLEIKSFKIEKCEVIYLIEIQKK